LILRAIARGFGEVGRTFSCRFEEIGHLLFWDSMILLMGFLVFEFEILFLVILLYNFSLLVVIRVFRVMVVELSVDGFRY
jgi:hypothetical protein